MSDCWAKCLGNCSGKMSREHIFSEGVHFSDQIKVQGFPWCKDQPVAIGLANLTKKILCEKHNSELSAADSAATSALRAMERVMALQKSHQRRVFKINGYELEGWFLKTLINLAFEGKCLIGKAGTELGIPSKHLVEIAFQRRRFQKPAGLYTLPRERETFPLDGSIRVTVVNRGEPTRVSGAVFIFAASRFFLHIDDDLTPSAENFTFHHEDLSQMQFMYRLRRMEFPVDSRFFTHTVEFQW